MAFLSPDVELYLSQLTSSVLETGGVTDLFAEIGLETADLTHLTDALVAQLQNSDTPHLAAEALLVSPAIRTCGKACGCSVRRFWKRRAIDGRDGGRQAIARERGARARRAGLRIALATSPGLVEAVVVHPLLTAPSASVTLDMVEDFVSLGIPENLTVEYKKQGDKPVEAVAALANTYGGIVLIGVAEDSGTRGVPTAVVGVNRKEKEKLVNQMATGYDPPWTPEVIEVPLREADKVVLVVRIDQDLVPAPIVTDGSILVRLDGRNVKANRQMMAAMLRQAEAVEPGLGLQRRNATRSPGIHWPVDGADPDAARSDLQLRAVTSVALPRGKHRDRLPSGIGGKMLLPLTQSKLRDVIQKFSDSPLRQGAGWKVHRITSRTIEFRLRDKGTGGSESVQPQGRVVVDVNGGFLEVIADISLWPRGGPLAWLAVQMAFLRLVPAVADVLLPAAVAAVTGPVTLPPPPVEIHLSNEKFAGEVVRIEKSIDLSPLGARTGSNRSALGRAGEVVDETLIKDGDWTPAVLDALTTMTMDWGYA